MNQPIEEREVIDSLVRDFTQVIPRSKSEVRIRIENLLEQERQRMSDEVSFAAYRKVDKTDLFCHGFNKGIRVAISIINK